LFKVDRVQNINKDARYYKAFKVSRNLLLLAVLLVLVIQPDYIYKWAKLIGSEKVENLTGCVTVLKATGNTNFEIDRRELEYINYTIPIVDSMIGVDNPIKFDVLFNEGNCSASTFPKSKLIVLNDCPERICPFIHEYIHIVFGEYDELWFSEGIATYLSMVVSSRKELDGIKDQNVHYFFDAWYTDSNSDVNWNEREELSYIDDLKRKYNPTEVDKIIGFKEKIDFNSLDNTVEFYRLSASFCEFLANEIGRNTLIELAKSKTIWNQSILNICFKANINLESYYQTWLEGFNKS